jgi:hypothetical protein
MNNIAYILTGDAITITMDGLTKTISKSQLNYQAVKKALLDQDITKLKQALDGEAFMGAITEGRVTFKDGHLMMNGSIVAETIAGKLTRILNEGLPAIPWLKFVDNLMDNPSKGCLDNLYEFLSHKGMPITQEGMCLGYKGVREDSYSYSGNAKTIVTQGEINNDHQILNRVGDTIEVSRNCVDDDPERGCSHGLHIGSFDYADSFAGEGKLLLVEFNPKDAVSVPHDCEYQKLRVTRYKIIKEITENRKVLEQPLYNIDDEGDLHTVSEPQLDKAVAQLEDYHQQLGVPIAINSVAKVYDVSPYDLITILVEKGYDIDWENLANPKAFKPTETDE